MIYNPLSDMSRIKESLCSLFCDDEDIGRLVMPIPDDPDFTWEQNWYGGKMEKTVSGQTKVTTLLGHCFDVPYMEGTVTDNRCAIFVETQLLRVPNKFLKEVGIDISIVCHKDAVSLSGEESSYFHAKGIYGNRVDCLCQAINSSILNPQIMETIQRKYSIGELQLSEKEPVRLYVPGTRFYGKILSFSYHTNYQTKAGR